MLNPKLKEQIWFVFELNNLAEITSAEFFTNQFLYPLIYDSENKKIYRDAILDLTINLEKEILIGKNQKK